jgi:ataxin-10
VSLFIDVVAVNLSTGAHAELLRLLDIFLPRINFGKPVVPPGSRPPHSPVEHKTTGFLYLKRDLVRLLGILCHANRAVQDRVRDCGGIEVVMGLCVIDDRNPCELMFPVSIPDPS